MHAGVGWPRPPHPQPASVRRAGWRWRGPGSCGQTHWRATPCHATRQHYAVAVRGDGMVLHQENRGAAAGARLGQAAEAV